MSRMSVQRDWIVCPSGHRLLGSSSGIVVCVHAGNETIEKEEIRRVGDVALQRPSGAERARHQKCHS